MSLRQYGSYGVWDDAFPRRSEYVQVVKDAAKGTRLRPAIKRKLTLFAKQTQVAVYGHDNWAHGSCPLRAVGVERTMHGGWSEDGACDFMRRYDKAMYRLTRVSGPCLISVRSDA